MGMAAESQFHVLAVDDSLIDRKLIERLLKRSSYQVTTVDSGTKALEFLGLRQGDDNNDPDTPSTSPKNHQEVDVNLIITDYCMPGMTGYDLLKKIKESSSLRNIPVVIMSSENVPSRITKCLEEGAEEFFLKPVRSSDLNRLKPHMMRTKLRNQMQEQIKKPEKEERSTKAEILSRQQQEQDREQQEKEHHHQEQRQQQQEQQKQEQQLQERQPINNKRKAMEEGLTQDRPRPRYDEITTAV